MVEQLLKNSDGAGSSTIQKLYRIEQLNMFGLMGYSMVEHHRGLKLIHPHRISFLNLFANGSGPT